jgi:hypothetical protein
MTDIPTFQTNRIPTWIPDLIFKYQLRVYFGLHSYLVRLVILENNLYWCSFKLFLKVGVDKRTTDYGSAVSI